MNGFKTQRLLFKGAVCLMDLTNGKLFVANKQKIEIQSKFVIFGERRILS